MARYGHPHGSHRSNSAIAIFRESFYGEPDKILNWWPIQDIIIIRFVRVGKNYYQDSN